MTDFASFRKKATNQQPLLYETNLSNVRVGSDGEVEVEDKTLPLDRSGFDDLRSIAGVTKAVAKRADDYLGDGASARLVESMRNGLSSQDDRSVAVAINRSENSVVGFNDDPNQLISMEGYFELAERIIDRYDLEVENATIGHDGSVNLSMKDSDRVVNLDGFGNALDDESFKAGISMSGRLGEVSFESFLYRLICTNGMIGEFWGDNLNINSLDSDDVFEFFDHVDAIADNGFLPEQFGESVSRAEQTYASLSEMEDVREEIARYYDGDDQRQVERFVPVREVYSEYRDEGIEPTELKERQKRNAVTPMKLWDLVNGLTRFASHDQTGKGFNVPESAQTRMMMKAGSMIERNTFDMENLVPVPSGFQLN